MPAARTWLRNPRFDLGLQIGALAGVAPALLLYAFWGSAQASSFVPLASLVAIPFLHVFASFFVAFSDERNQSATSPQRLAAMWLAWAASALVLQATLPRALATFALLYGGWHIFRQNFGFLRELARRGGAAGDRALRRLDHAACAAPALALWLLVSTRGPWRFIGADIFHVAVPEPLLAVALAAVPVTAALRALRGPRAIGFASVMLLAGNAAALLVPALFLDDLTLVYTLSASFHGIQYLAYVSERERERQPDAHPTSVLAPLGGAIVLSMLGWTLAVGMCASFLSPAHADTALLVAWYAIVPFHYFVDGRIWRPALRRSRLPAQRSPA